MTAPARGFFGGRPRVTPRQRVADHVRVQVRAGLLDESALLADVTATVAADLAGEDAAATARALLGEASASLVVEQERWPRPTDYERLQRAVADLERHRVVVVQAVEDHWVADAELRRRAISGQATVGVVWFTAPDVWHAVDHGMLELNVWHADTANVAPGQPLLDLVLATLAGHGLTGHFAEGRVEVALDWQRRLRVG